MLNIILKRYDYQGLLQKIVGKYAGGQPVILKEQKSGLNAAIKAYLHFAWFGATFQENKHSLLLFNGGQSCKFIHKKKAGLINGT